MIRVTQQNSASGAKQYYAAADYYISLVCATLGVGSSSSMSAPAICTNPSISDMTALAEKA